MKGKLPKSELWKALPIAYSSGFLIGSSAKSSDAPGHLGGLTFQWAWASAAAAAGHLGDFVLFVFAGLR